MQIDPIEYSLLLYTLEKQQKEIIRLKNRLDFVEPKKELKKKNSKSMDLTVPVETWNCQHFIRYFLKCFQEAYGEVYLMESTAWRIGAFKITKFWERHPELTKPQYRDFIDYLFETVSENYKLKLGLITKDDQLKNYKDFCSKRGKIAYNAENGEGFKRVDESLPEAGKNANETVERMRKTFGINGLEKS
jgi:hypothetical protein